MSVSDARYFLLMGWARYLSLRIDLNRQLDDIAKRRGTRFGILRDDDHYALEYQRLEFRIQRANRAVGMQGLSGHASFDGEKFVVTDQATLDKRNKDNFDIHYRQRAHRAKKLIGEGATCGVPCLKCVDEMNREIIAEIEAEAMGCIR